jgi:hypothetical protein
LTWPSEYSPGIFTSLSPPLTRLCRWVKEKHGGKLLYVGDGDNDRLAMEMEADLAIASAPSSSRLTKAAADALLTEGDLHGVLGLVKLAREGGHKVKPRAAPAPAPAPETTVTYPSPKRLSQKPPKVEASPPVQQVDGNMGCTCTVS